MSRSPWRDALDGQITVLRSLRQESSHIHIATGFKLPSPSLFYSDINNQTKLQMMTARTVAEGWEAAIREAEPVYLSHDIREELAKRVQRDTRKAADDSTWDLGPLTAAMLPIPSGLIWLGNTGYQIHDVPTDDTGATASVYIRALYFGNPQEPVMEPLNDGVDISTYYPDNTQRISMGVMIFVDAQRSGYANMARKYGNHLVPMHLGEWHYGKTFFESLKISLKHSENATNLAGATILSCGAYLVLYELFMLMLQRLTRWGGVGLNREEQKEAERERLRPRVQLVTWRKANYQYPEGHIPVPKNWSCRWPVTEHYRHYKSGKTVKIQSYVKGPHDKPFRGPTKRAHQVKY